MALLFADARVRIARVMFPEENDGGEGGGGGGWTVLYTCRVVWRWGVGGLVAVCGVRSSLCCCCRSATALSVSGDKVECPLHDVREGNMSAHVTALETTWVHVHGRSTTGRMTTSVSHGSRALSHPLHSNSPPWPRHKASEPSPSPIPPYHRPPSPATLAPLSSVPTRHSHPPHTHP